MERSGSTRTKAENTLKEALVNIPTPTSASITGDTHLEDLAKKFIDTKRSANLAPRSLDSYQWAITAAIVPEIGALRVREASTERLDRFLVKVAEARGKGAAKTCRSVLSGMMGLAVRSGAGKINPVREVSSISRKNEGAKLIPINAMPEILAAVAADEELRRLDLVDLVELWAGTGLRISESLALEWPDVDIEAGTLSVRANVVRVKGQGLLRQPHTKTDAGERTIIVPARVVNMLLQRRVSSSTDLVFPSMFGKLRDPNNTLADWREHRDAVGAAGSTPHSFRKYVATVLDKAGLSAREIAEYLGHKRPSLTQDIYMSRKVGGSDAAAALSMALA
ncbi:site-specific integrase [Leifsonia sp. ZF2019]|uniref:site-specific integrase n=1 Tax=Leifsonia sp. ZF2019 TaxID=2781978 RepID=UPI001CBCE0D8|nr:site-specific integrase [Leifsonia sp. ZF2019]UAJ78628.1 site-specific integrase [Leifsonia sp. ZF2019]